VTDPSSFLAGPVTDLKCDEWKAFSARHPNASAVNLNHVHGDATAALTECWVVCNIADAAAVRAMPEEEIIKVLKDRASFKGKPVYAVYVLGDRVGQRVVKAAKRAKA